ncbi:MAG TPA: hypothetical protein VI893_01105 [Thermoplasmata archaeon]|nr:hypothetical protein [Thermoplasmata archaeon]
MDENSLESPLTDSELAAHIKEVRDRHPSVFAYYNLLSERGPMERAAIEKELCIALAEAVDSRRLMLVQKWITSGLVRQGKERLDEWTGTHYRLKEKYAERVRKLLTG